MWLKWSGVEGREDLEVCQEGLQCLGLVLVNYHGELPARVRYRIPGWGHQEGAGAPL